MKRSYGPKAGVRRQPRIGDRRHIQIYVDNELHDLIMRLARQQNISRSMVARQLMARGAETIPTTEIPSHGN
jgi:hypothetical protein